MLRIRIVRTIGHRALLAHAERQDGAVGAAQRGPACDGRAGGKRKKYAPISCRRRSGRAYF
ncbi:hypothetical protein CA830_05285 [Burkholderia multivorans]|nr:hypothetical protein CA831_34255 [Burkholderia multivorans]OXH93822.1 hypothetical protein CA830_05285 [Burkholderia multivorans]